MDGVDTLKLLMTAGKWLEGLGTGNVVDERTLRDSSRIVSEAGEIVARFRRLGEVQELMLEVTALVEAGVPAHKAYVDVQVPHLDTATGYNGWLLVLSVELERAALMSLKFDRVVAPDAVTRFNHRMVFKKTAGFGPVEPLETTMSMTAI